MQKLFYLLSGDKEYISKKKLADIMQKKEEEIGHPIKSKI